MGKGLRVTSSQAEGLAVVPHIPDLKRFRREARLSQGCLARPADLDRGTVSSAENHGSCQDIKRYAIITLNNVHYNRIGNIT
jgi:DNA-binding XRE family transcriptional regulator